MQSYTSIGEAVSALRGLAYNPPAGLSDELKEALVKSSNEISPVAAIVGCAELLYAHREDLNPDELAIAAGLASFATENGWHGLASDDRGVSLVGALRRQAGEKPVGKAWPKAENDPEPKPEYAKAPAEPETPPIPLPEPEA